MRLFFLFFILISFVFHDSLAQGNLVPNPSFEIHDSCPDNLDHISMALGWKSLNLSPDYFHKCSDSSMTIPMNRIDFQDGFSSSDSAYAGFMTTNYRDTTREFLGIELTSPMQIGVRYFISFIISATNRGNCSCFCDKIGVKFLNNFQSLNNHNSHLIDNTAHFYIDSILTDSINWIFIKGSFIADSAYTAIVIGNFFKLDHMNIYCLNGIGVYAYYFIDRICVSSDSSYCNSLTYQGEIDVNPNIKVVYLSSNQQIKIEKPLNDSRYTKFELYNSLGQIVLNSNLNNATVYIDVPNISAGIYILRISDFIYKLYIGP